MANLITLSVIKAANPFNTAGLVTDPAMHRGFEFEVLDVL